MILTKRCRKEENEPNSGGFLLFVSLRAVLRGAVALDDDDMFLIPTTHWDGSCSTWQFPVGASGWSSGKHLTPGRSGTGRGAEQVQVTPVWLELTEHRSDMMLHSSLGVFEH